MIKKVYNNLIKNAGKQEEINKALYLYGGARFIVDNFNNKDVNSYREIRKNEAITYFKNGNKKECFNIYSTFIKNSFRELKNNNPHYAIDNIIHAFEIEKITKINKNKTILLANELITKILNKKYLVKDIEDLMNKYQKGVLKIIKKYEN